ncbi:MAG: hypothetical protein J3R72DRAFT_430024 [Linnemannia gamsii]|nr:MAG: hypothetical protein J3R72DRAFT_430024 [Linnemannia gamsii]
MSFSLSLALFTPPLLPLSSSPSHSTPSLSKQSKAKKVSRNACPCPCFLFFFFVSQNYKHPKSTYSWMTAQRSVPNAKRERRAHNFFLGLQQRATQTHKQNRRTTFLLYVIDQSWTSVGHAPSLEVCLWLSLFVLRNPNLCV